MREGKGLIGKSDQRGRLEKGREAMQKRMGGRKGRRRKVGGRKGRMRKGGKKTYIKGRKEKGG